MDHAGFNLIQRYAKDPSAINPVYTLQTRDYYYAFNPDTPLPLVKAFQKAIDLIRTEKETDGIAIYDKILHRYLTPSYANSPLTAENAVELVNLTADSLARDAQKTIKDINAGTHPYRDADQPSHYVFVYDTNVTMIAHAENIRMVGVSYHGKTDVAGKPFRDLIVQGALQNGSGWEDYVYSNPVEGGLFWKTSRYQLVTGSDGKEYVVCSGVFKQLHTDSKE
jgi:polar amino acid transport system substrate-binding protein